MNRRLLETSNKNRLEELYARSMEEFLISGVVIHRKWCGTKNGFKASVFAIAKLVTYDDFRKYSHYSFKKMYEHDNYSLDKGW